jgi:hypothetical protein
VTVLVIAPYRPDLPNVATEAAAVVNALGGQLVQGQVTERDIRDAASAGCFDGIWFATHVGVTPEREIRALLSDGFLSETAILSYVAASGASWCFINTCQSITGGLRIIDETPADVICTISDLPDPDAMRTGVLFARQLAQLGEPRAAYERSKPGGNRLYVYLENYRQRQMAVVGSAGPYPAQDRLQATMDDMRKDLAKVGTDVEVLKSGTIRTEARQQRMEDRLDAIEYQLRPTPTWQTWALLLIGLVTCVGITLLLIRAGG